MRNSSSTEKEAFHLAQIIDKKLSVFHRTMTISLIYQNRLKSRFFSMLFLLVDSQKLQETQLRITELENQLSSSKAQFSRIQSNYQKECAIARKLVQKLQQTKNQSASHSHSMLVKFHTYLDTAYQRQADAEHNSRKFQCETLELQTQLDRANTRNQILSDLLRKQRRDFNIEYNLLVENSRELLDTFREKMKI